MQSCGSGENLLEVFSFFEKNKIDCKFDLVINSIDGHFVTQIDDLVIFRIQFEDVISYYRGIIENNDIVYVKKIINDIKRIHFGVTNEIACGASIDGFFIDIDGKIFPCSAHSSEGLSVGDIFTMIDYERIVSNKWYAQAVDSYTLCKACWMKYLCSGACFAQKWTENGNTEDPSIYLCKGFDIYWSAIVKLYVQLYPVIISGVNVNFSKNEKH
jgi:uncharacterized protein